MLKYYVREDTHKKVIFVSGQTLVVQKNLSIGNDLKWIKSFFYKSVKFEFENIIFLILFHYHFLLNNIEQNMQFFY